MQRFNNIEDKIRDKEHKITGHDKSICPILILKNIEWI